jgi:4-hydroxyphenylpyruvate dioxygenase
MADLFDNPLGTRGFEFIEYTGDATQLAKLFSEFGFTKVAHHKSRDILLYRQGNITLLLNAEQGGRAAAFRDKHKGGASAMGFRVADARFAYKEALKRGARAITGAGGAFDTAGVPAIESVDGAVIYLVDNDDIYGQDFEFISPLPDTFGVGLTHIDHLTHNLRKGNMAVWGKFYEDVFGFREIRYFNIEGKLTGLISRAMTSPCGRIRIPLNEGTDAKSQINEFLERFNGEGIQHVAFETGDIVTTVKKMKALGVAFQDTPDTYYEALDTRVPGHGEDIPRLRDLRILMDGAPTKGQGILLQIFTVDEIGPVFFELIQRKGNEGFGEGNFKALFDSIELDQIRRGYLRDTATGL